MERQAFADAPPVPPPCALLMRCLCTDNGQDNGAGDQEAKTADLACTATLIAASLAPRCGQQGCGTEDMNGGQAGERDRDGVGALGSRRRRAPRKTPSLSRADPKPRRPPSFSSSGGSRPEQLSPDRPHRRNAAVAAAVVVLGYANGRRSEEARAGSGGGGRPGAATPVCPGGSSATGGEEGMVAAATAKATAGEETGMAGGTCRDGRRKRERRCI